MYIPRHFAIEDRQELLAFMQRYNFAAIVTTQDGAMTATHAPLLVRENGDGIYLTGHFARANDHWKAVASSHEILVLFTGPHAYISPSLYDSKAAVPTWNYAAVHAYGHGRIVDAEPALMALVEAMEPAYRQQWEQLPSEFRSKMISGVVAFEIQVGKLEGKFKLSQNRPMQDQLSVAEAFDGTELGALMSARLHGAMQRRS